MAEKSKDKKRALKIRAKLQEFETRKEWPEVDVRCFYTLSDSIIERLLLCISDRDIDPPPLDLPALKVFPQSWDDDDWCSKPPGPRPPLGKDILSKIQKLPRTWAFAKCRVETADTVSSRLDETLSAMSISVKQLCHRHNNRVWPMECNPDIQHRCS